MKRTLTLSNGNVMEIEMRSPYAKCQVCGRPCLSYGRPCDHVDRSPGKRLMPEWCDNPAEWQMLCDLYGVGNISRCGRLGRVDNHDGTFRNERLA